MAQMSSSDKFSTLRSKDLGRVASDLWQNYYIVVAFIAMVIVSAIVSPTFFSWVNISNVLRQSAVPGIVSLGMLAVILTAGIDLSVGSLVAITGVLAVGLQRQLPLVGALLVAILVGLAAGGFNGVLVAKRNVPPFIATLGMMVIARGLTYVYTDGGPIQVVYKDAYSLLGRSNIGPFPTIVIIWLILAAATSVVLKRTTFGRTIVSLGSNAHAVYLSGINVDLHLIAVYVISGFMTAVGGILLTSRLTIGTPLMGNLMELDAIAAVVIGGASLSGGRGTVWGTIVGVLILGLISNMLNLMGVSAFYQDIIRGTIILLAVLFKAAQES
jgi:ribose/xylose/arabinose/galactoside ABC-type transport system permease subunit